MAIGYAHTLFCDRRGCRKKQTVEGTRDASHARRLARMRHGWGCDETGDFCPTDKTVSRDSVETSHTRCETKGER
ncbi:hypothetical protein [Streptomyces sp. 1222.5]|uniref:hypothetical protein n=1 Tax=Streptomyces sp. 1222.5 TaxID=1881026 RepID=UPI003D70ABE5